MAASDKSHVRRTHLQPLSQALAICSQGLVAFLRSAGTEALLNGHLLAHCRHHHGWLRQFARVCLTDKDIEKTGSNQQPCWTPLRLSVSGLTFRSRANPAHEFLFESRSIAETEFS